MDYHRVSDINGSQRMNLNYFVDLLTSGGVVRLIFMRLSEKSELKFGTLFILLVTLEFVTSNAIEPLTSKTVSVP